MPVTMAYRPTKYFATCVPFLIPARNLHLVDFEPEGYKKYRTPRALSWHPCNLLTKTVLTISLAEAAIPSSEDPNEKITASAEIAAGLESLTIYSNIHPLVITFIEPTDVTCDIGAYKSSIATLNGAIA